MGRTVSAKLSLEIDDGTLIGHIERVKEARESWLALDGALKGVVGQDMTSLRGLLSTLSGELGKVSTASNKMKMEPFAKALIEIDGVLAALNGKLGPFVTHVTNLAPVLDAVAKSAGAWTKGMSGMASVIDRLQERLESMMEQQSKTDRHLAEFATKVAMTNDVLKTQGAEMLKVIQAYAGFNKAADNAAKKQDEVKKATEKSNFSFKSMEQGFIRNSAALFIITHQLDALYNTMKDAATQADLGIVLGRSLPHFTQMMEDTRKSTRGMVSDLAILKNAALMSSFGIPMEHFAQNMELVQKLALRTGQSTEYLMDSFGRGISRLSPAILDNLGLQIKLKDAYANYAASIGKATNALTTQEKKTAVMQEVLRQATDLTANVDAEGALSSRLEQTRTRVINAFNSIKVAILDTLADITSTSAEAAGKLAAELEVRLKQVKDGLSAGPIKESFFTHYIMGNGPVEKFRDAVGAMTAGFTNLSAAGRIHLREIEDAFKKLQEGRATKEDLEILRDESQTWETIASNLPEAADAMLDYSKRFHELQMAKGEGKSPMRFGFESQAEMDEQIGFLSTFLHKGQEQLKSFATTMQQFSDYAHDIPSFAEHMFPDNPQAQAAFRTRLTEELDKARSQVRRMAEAGEYEGIAEFFEKWQANTEDIAALQTKTTVHQSQLANEAANKRLAALDLELEGVKMLAAESRGLTENEAALSLMKKATQEMDSAYMEKRKELGEKYTEAEVTAEAKKLETQYKQLAVLEAKVQAEKEFNKILFDDSVLSKGTLDSEAGRIELTKTAKQLTAEWYTLRIDEANAVVTLTLATEQYFETFFEGSMMQKFAALQNMAAAKEHLDMLKKQIELNNLALKKGGGGGGGGGKKKEEDPFDLGKAIMAPKAKEWSEFFIELRKDGGVALQELTRHFEDTWVNGKLLYGYMTKIFHEKEIIPKELFTNPHSLEEQKKQIEFNDKIIKQIEIWKKEHKDMDASVGESYVHTLKDQNAALKEHLALMKQISETVRDASDSIKSAFSQGKGLIGDDVLASLNTLTDGLSSFAEAASKTDDSGKLAVSGINAIGNFTASLVKNLKTRAAIQMLMEAAAAFAAFPDIPAMLAHGTAATIYGLVAGGAIKLPSKATSDSGKNADAKAAQNQAPINVYLYGEMIMSQAELGVKVDEGVRQAVAEGRL